MGLVTQRVVLNRGHIRLGTTGFFHYTRYYKGTRYLTTMMTCTFGYTFGHFSTYSTKGRRGRLFTLGRSSGIVTRGSVTYNIVFQTRGTGVKVKVQHGRTQPYGLIDRVYTRYLYFMGTRGEIRVGVTLGMVLHRGRNNVGKGLIVILGVQYTRVTICIHIYNCGVPRVNVSRGVLVPIKNSYSGVFRGVGPFQFICFDLLCGCWRFGKFRGGGADHLFNGVGRVCRGCILL